MLVYYFESGYEFDIIWRYKGNKGIYSVWDGGIN